MVDGGPVVGMVVCDCRYKHQRITVIDDDQDTVTLEDGHMCSFHHCCDLIPHDWKHPSYHDGIRSCLWG